MDPMNGPNPSPRPTQISMYLIIFMISSGNIDVMRLQQVTCSMMSPCPWMNLRITASALNVCGFDRLAMAPRANVEEVSRENPTMTAFLAPILFLMMELTGAKMHWAMEKILRIREMSIESNLQPSSEIHSWSSMKGGMNEAMFSIIMLPTQSASRQAIKAFFLTSGLSAVACSSTSALPFGARPLWLEARDLLKDVDKFRLPPSQNDKLRDLSLFLGDRLRFLFFDCTNETWGLPINRFSVAVSLSRACSSVSPSSSSCVLILLGYSVLFFS